MYYSSFSSLRGDKKLVSGMKSVVNHIMAELLQFKVFCLRMTLRLYWIVWLYSVRFNRHHDQLVFIALSAGPSQSMQISKQGVQLFVYPRPNFTLIN